ncbi:MAG: NAD(P)H-dependent oxidoreductase [Candidatus Hydrogenedentes bacterium]|nr:NAD(P)H-dependent oxidoreductase [Candidatus Hydrogenedentota bacterium]
MTHNAPPAIHLVAVSGSVRRDGYTRRFLDLMIGMLEAYPGVTVDCIDPADFQLAFPGQPEAGAFQRALTDRVTPADGILLSTPEYHGSYSSVIKVLIDSMGYPSVMAGKPVSLLGIATGRLGAIKALEHLRSVCSHAGAIVLPYPVSVAEAHNRMDAAGACTDPDINEQMAQCARQLVAYTRSHASLKG